MKQPKGKPRCQLVLDGVKYDKTKKYHNATTLPRDQWRTLPSLIFFAPPIHIHIKPK